MKYSAFLETCSKGLWMAHVLDLPGCFLRASSREEAVNLLPLTILQYLDWRYHHGEGVKPEEGNIQVIVNEEINGMGPFDPGDDAALFAPELERITPQEMEPYYRLMAHSRVDLLDLSMTITQDMLDSQPEPGSFSIRRILRHIGNAEEWYVSRILPPGRLPPEWENDENLPIFDYLEMERRTALVCLRNFTDEERSGVFHPIRWTTHPSESWTARKVLRRFIEHEREHTAQLVNIIRRR